MPKNSDILEFEGEIIDVLPGQMYKVRVDDFNREVTCYTGGKMKKNKIRLVLGDKVQIEMSPYDLDKGRITYRV